MPKTKEAMLSTFEIKQRGWSASMIQKLLPGHDGTRENGLDRNYGEVKLYRESRVVEAESTSVFAELMEKAIQDQERAARAQASKKENLEKFIQDTVSSYQPTIEVQPQEELLEASKGDLDHVALRIWWRTRHHIDDHMNRHERRMSRKERDDLFWRLTEKHFEILRPLYPWVDFKR